MFYYPDLGLFVLRLVVGIIFVYHSMPKLKKPGSMAAGIGFPVWGVRVLGLVELVSGLAVIVGFRTTIFALLLALTMIGAIYKKIFAWKVSFWSQTSTGWEYDLALLAAAIAIALTAGGAYML